MINLYNADCLEALKGFTDNQFDLAIVDPPYGIDLANMNMGIGKSKRASKIKNRKWVSKDWDKYPPKKDYFNELFRVSKNQIIWGGNYFSLPPTKYFAVWDKGEGMRGRSFAEGEYAWVSSGGTRIGVFNPVDKNRFHPTQKPVKLYKWLLKNYAKEGNTILDTHLGSGSIAIACHDMGFDLTAYEIDQEYYEAAVKRLSQHQSQISLGL